MLLTIRPRRPVPSGYKSPSPRVTGEGGQPDSFSLRAPRAPQGPLRPHQALSVDRIRGRSHTGMVKMVQFSEAKQWSDIEQTHIRLFEFLPGGRP